MTGLLTEGPVKRRLALFTLPILVSNILQQLYSAADAVIVGRVAGGNSLAAVGASTPIITLLVALMIGLGAGTEIILARKVGEKDAKGQKITLDSMLTTILVIAVITMLIGFLGSRFLLSLIGTPAEILDEAVLYLKYYFLGLVGVAGYNTLSGLIRSSGNAIVPLILLLISAVLNIGLDLTFVGGLGMGVKGAAIATVLSQTIAFICCLIYTNTKKGMIRYNPFHLKISLTAIKQGFIYGIPCSVQQCANSIGMIVLQIAVNSLGTQVVTAYTVGSKIDSFANIPISGIGQSLCIFTSQNLGADKPDRVRKGKRFSLMWAYGYSLFLVLLFWGTGKAIPSLFCSDLAVAKMAESYIRVLSIAYFMASYWVVLHGFIQGTGNTAVPMAITLVGNWGARLPLAYILKSFWGEMGVWLAVPSGWVASVILTWLFLHSKYYKEKLKKQGM